MDLTAENRNNTMGTNIVHGSVDFNRIKIFNFTNKSRKVNFSILQILIFSAYLFICFTLYRRNI